jgi:hypothetical protein
MKHIIKSNFFTMLIAANASFAAMNIAILEITVPEDNEDIEITVEETKFLTDELRSLAVSAFPQDKYTVLTREDIIKLLPQNEEEVERLARAGTVDVGRALGVEYVSQGKINIFGDKLSLKVEFYESASGKLLGSFTGESDNATGFLSIIREKAPNMFDKIVPKPPPPPPSSSEPERRDSVQDQSSAFAIGFTASGPLGRATIAIEAPGLKLGVTGRVGFAKSGVKEGRSGLAYSAGFVAVKNFGFWDFVPEALFSSEEFEISEKKASFLNIEVPLTARIVFAKILGITLGTIAEFPLSSKIENEAPKDASSFRFATTGGLSYLFTEDIFVNAFYVIYFTDNFKSVNNSNTDKVLCGINYLF